MILVQIAHANHDHDGREATDHHDELTAEVSSAAATLYPVVTDLATTTAAASASER